MDIIDIETMSTDDLSEKAFKLGSFKFVPLLQAQAEIAELEDQHEKSVEWMNEELDRRQTKIDSYKKLIDQIEKACNYSHPAHNIQLLINNHKGE